MRSIFAPDDDVRFAATAVGETAVFLRYSKNWALSLMELKTLKGWAARQMDARDKKIALVVTDIEGCLNFNERVYDFGALEWIRHLNRLARPDRGLP